MSNVLELKQQLSSLSNEQRAELAEYLIESLDEPTDQDTAEAWQAELTRRAAELQSGAHPGELAEAVMDRLRRKHT